MILRRIRKSKLIALLERDRFDKVIDLANKRIERGKGDFLTFYSRATARWRSYTKRGFRPHEVPWEVLNRCIDDYENSLHLKADFAASYLLLGSLYAHKAHHYFLNGDFFEAKKFFDKAQEHLIKAEELNSQFREYVEEDLFAIRIRLSEIYGNLEGIKDSIN